MSATQIPTTMKALITQANNTSKVQDVPVPTTEDDEVLVRTVAVALNPVDWKFIDFFNIPGTIVGCDVAGKVVKVGKNVTNVAVGDNVASFVHGGIKPDLGSHAQYVKAAGELVWKIPDGSITLEEAATISCGLYTGVQALFHPKRLGLVEPPQKVSGEQWVFIYGGSSSLGLYGINLAHLAGYKVVTVASPRNFELVKSYGADAVFDYKDPSVVDKIKGVTHNTLHHVYDTISSPSSQILSIKALAPGPGTVITVTVVTEEAKKLRHEDVHIEHTVIYSALGREYPFIDGLRPAEPADRAHMAHFLKSLPQFVKDKLIRPNPVKLWEEGLESIPDGLQYLKDGKNSGEKLVIRVD
ncbi:zinc-containing alcohol dehydrogenase family protein [Abortiporus biennis]